MLFPIAMRSRLLMLRNISTVILSRKYAVKPIRCDAHMNELPIPCGPWHIYYKDQQAYYNKTLVAGILWWCMSLVLMLGTGSFYLNWGPPAQPGPPSDMIEECEADQ